MTYHPCTAVLSDAHGRFLEVVVCDCDDGEPGWVPDYESCPVHSRVLLKQGFEAGGSNREASTEDASGSPPPRPTGTRLPQSLPRRKW